MDHRRTRYDKKASDQIMASYKSLKRLSDVYNDLWGPITLISMLDYIVWLAIDLDSGLHGPNWIAKISAIWFFVAVFIPLLACGEVNRKVLLFLN